MSGRVIERSTDDIEHFLSENFWGKPGWSPTKSSELSTSFKWQSDLTMVRGSSVLKLFHGKVESLTLNHSKDSNGNFYFSCNTAARVAAIEKWTAVADICRCLHNFNGVLQISAAFTSASIYRLRKTWDKVPKNVRTLQFRLGMVINIIQFLDTNNYRQASNGGLLRRTIPRVTRSAASMRSPLHPVLGNVPDRLVIHWRGNTGFHSRRIVELLQNANG